MQYYYERFRTIKRHTLHMLLSKLCIWLMRNQSALITAFICIDCFIWNHFFYFFVFSDLLFVSLSLRHSRAYFCSPTFFSLTVSFPSPYLFTSFVIVFISAIVSVFRQPLEKKMTVVPTIWIHNHQQYLINTKNINDSFCNYSKP